MTQLPEKTQQFLRSLIEPPQGQQPTPQRTPKLQAAFARGSANMRAKLKLWKETGEWLKGPVPTQDESLGILPISDASELDE